MNAVNPKTTVTLAGIEEIYRNRQKFKSDTTQLQYSLKTDTCPACPCAKIDSTAQLA